jgi:hypothetical protein
MAHSVCPTSWRFGMFGYRNCGMAVDTSSPGSQANTRERLRCRVFVLR